VLDRRTVCIGTTYQSSFVSATCDLSIVLIY
jgi:hypothetical protein